MAVRRHKEPHKAVLAAEPSPPRRGELDGRRQQRRRGAGLTGLLARWTPLAEDEILGLAEVIAPGAVCVDVGANYGLYTNALSWLAGYSGAVHSVEPLPGAFGVLVASSTLAGAGNVRRHRLALSDTVGTSTLSLPMRHGLPVHGRAFLTAGANGHGANGEWTRFLIWPSMRRLQSAPGARLHAPLLTGCGIPHRRRGCIALSKRRCGKP